MEKGIEVYQRKLEKDFDLVVWKVELESHDFKRHSSANDFAIG